MLQPYPQAAAVHGPCTSTVQVAFIFGGDFPSGRAGVMNPTRRRILIAHCHEDVLIMLEKALEDAGFDTTTVWTAKETLEMVALHAFDLMLVSKYLPDARCEELLTALQRAGRYTPFLVMQPSEPEIVDLAR